MTDDELATIKGTVAILVKHSSRRARRAILKMLDELEQEDTAIMDDHPNPGYPDEGEDELDLSAPVGDRIYVPQPLLDLDGQMGTIRGVDSENGEVVEGPATLVIVPEIHKEAARRRGVDVDA
ncbi:MAG TPA: hypothetical protein VND88_03810 [Candidatus Acidoferrales bacterium]|nr:hypothetical protein [Candidatus Acidoferrales bacterium]